MDAIFCYKNYLLGAASVPSIRGSDHLCSITRQLGQVYVAPRASDLNENLMNVKIVCDVSHLLSSPCPPFKTCKIMVEIGSWSVAKLS